MLLSIRHNGWYRLQRLQSIILWQPDININSYFLASGWHMFGVVKKKNAEINMSSHSFWHILYLPTIRSCVFCISCILSSYTCSWNAHMPILALRWRPVKGISMCWWTLQSCYASRFHNDSNGMTSQESREWRKQQWTQDKPRQTHKACAGCSFATYARQKKTSPCSTSISLRDAKPWKWTGF